MSSLEKTIFYGLAICVLGMVGGLIGVIVAMIHDRRKP